MKISFNKLNLDSMSKFCFIKAGIQKFTDTVYLDNNHQYNDHISITDDLDLDRSESEYDIITRRVDLSLVFSCVWILLTVPSFPTTLRYGFKLCTEAVWYILPRAQVHGVALRAVGVALRGV